MRARFVRVEWENESHTIASFYFEPAGRYRYHAGQYAVINVPHVPADTRGVERTMTLSTSPDNPLVGFTMRIMPAGRSSSFKQALLQLKPGDEITVFESMGDLVLPLDSNIPLVWIAGGVGIASFTGMAAWLTAHNDMRSIQLYHVVARPADLVMQNIFTQYQSVGNLTTSLYTPDVNRLTGAAIMQAAKPDSLFYISGTEKMVETFRQELVDAGVPRSAIVFDYFDGYSEL